MKHLNTLFFAFLIVQFAQAQQQQLWENITPQSFQYSYSNVEGSSKAHLQKMFKAAYPQNYSTSSFRIGYNELTRVMKGIGSNSKKISFQVELQQFYLENAPNYRGFSLEQDWYPKQASIKVQGTRPDGTVLFTQVNVINIENQNGQQPFNYTFTDSLESSVYNLAIIETEFLFTNQNADAIQNKVNQINSYNTANETLIQLYNDLLTWNVYLEDPDALDQAKQQGAELRERYNKVKALNFWQGLGLDQTNAFDPLTIKQNDLNCIQELEKRETELNGRYARLHQLLYNKGRNFFTQNNYTEAGKYANKAIEAQAGYLAPQALLVDIHIAQNKWTEAETRLDDKFVKGLTIADSTRTIVLEANTKIQDYYLNLAQQESNNKKHRAAEAAWNKANKRCAFPPMEGYATCNIQQLNAVHQTFATAWFNEYYTVAQTELQTQNTQLLSGQYKEAEQAIQRGLTAYDSAKVVNNTHQNFIVVAHNLSQTEQSLTSAFMDCKINMSRTAYPNKTADEMGGMVEELNSWQATTSQKYPTLLTRQADFDALIRELQQNRYNKYVADGDNLQNAGKSAEALQNYEKAKTLNAQYGFDGNAAALDNKAGNAAKSDILQECATLLASSDNDMIREKYATLKGQAQQYNLMGDQGITVIFGQVDAHICYNAENLLLKTQRDSIAMYRNSKEYLKAAIHFRKAKELIKEYSTCAIDDSDLTAMEAEIIACEGFQALMEEVDDLERQENFNMAIKKIEEAKGLYNSGLAKDYLSEPSHFDLYNHVQSYSQAEYAWQACVHYTNESDNVTGYDLLKRACRLGIDTKKTKYIQERYGTWLAKENFDRGQKWSDVWFQQIDGMKKELKFTKKNFKKQWKSMGG